MTTFLVHSHPTQPPLLPPQTLEMDGGFLVRTWESSKAIQHPWKCNHFWGWYSCLMGLLGSALGCPSASVSLLTKGTGLGFPVLHFQALSLDIVHRAQEAVLFL